MVDEVVGHNVSETERGRGGRERVRDGGQEGIKKSGRGSWSLRCKSGRSAVR